jgi:tetratricopeptide (TPR) repeat protein
MTLSPAAQAEFSRGEERYRAGAYAEAATIFRRLAKQQPQDSGALRMLGLCRLRLGKLPEALRLLAKAAAIAPGDPYAQLHLGIGLHTAGRHREAAERFAACRETLPEDPAPFLNLSSSLLALGDVAGALDAARRARRRAPDMPETHYTLGLALLAAERFAEAAAAFDACLKRAPEFADAWVNLGVAHYRLSNIDAAKGAMRRALAIAPRHRAAAANLGAFLRLTGEVESGERLLREVVAAEPDAAEARLNLVADLLQEDRGGEALALLEAARMPVEPRLNRHWLMQKSLALLQRGRAAEARNLMQAIGDVPPGLEPLMLWRRIHLALAERDVDAARRLAGEMEAALAAGGVSILPEHRIMGHFDLARFWSQQGDGARAFPQWREGHRLLGLMQPFSRDRSGGFFAANSAEFSRVRLHEGPRAANRDPAPVFIVGMPRSGTTLIEQIIGAHHQAFAAGERAALAVAWHRFGGETADAVRRVAALDGAALDAAAADYLRELHALAPEAARVVDKMPGNFNFLGLAALMLPAARIIHCARDPRDIGLSIFTFRFYGYHPYAHHLGDLGWYIGQHHRLMAHWREALPNPLLTVRLQDWVEDFAGTLKRVLEFLDLPYDPACERFYEQDSRVRTVSRAQVRQPVNARGLGRWRPFAEELQPLIKELAAAEALPDA